MVTFHYERVHTYSSGGVVMLQLNSMIVLFIMGVAVMISIMVIVQKGFRSNGYFSGIQYGKTVQLLQDKHDLHTLGIGQYLRRHYGEWSSFSLSFNYLGVLSTTLLLSIPIISNVGAPLALILFLIVGIVFILTQSLIAQLLSVYPTAGGLYHVMYAHTNSVIANIIGSLKLIGHICSILFYAYGTVWLLSILLRPYTTLLDHTYIFHLAIILVVILQLLLHSLKSSISIFVQWIGFSIGAIAILFVVGIAGYSMFTDSVPAISAFYGKFEIAIDGIQTQKTMPLQIGLALALLCKWFTGGEESASASEETYEPKVRTPWSICQSSMYSYIIGFVLLLVVMVSLLNVSISNKTLAFNEALFSFTNLSTFIGSCVMILSIITCFSSGMTSIFHGSRGLFAMARDGQIIFSGFLSAVSFHKQIPERSTFAVAVLSIISSMGLLFIPRMNAIVILTLIVVTCYMLIYVMVIYFAKEKQAKGLWSLGKWYKPMRAALMLPLITLLTISAYFLPWYILVAMFAICIICVMIGLSKVGVHSLESGKVKYQSFEIEAKLPLQ